MNVLLTGATGYVGSNVLAALLAAGHEVLAVTRSETSAEQARQAGAKAVVHDLTDTAWLVGRAGQRSTPRSTPRPPGTRTTRRSTTRSIDAVVAAFAGTDKRYLHTSGIWIWGAGQVAEDGPLDPPAIVAWRIERENRLLAADVRATIIAPAIVYGHDRGIVGGRLRGRLPDAGRRRCGSSAPATSTGRRCTSRTWPTSTWRRCPAVRRRRVRRGVGRTTRRSARSRRRSSAPTAASCPSPTTSRAPGSAPSFADALLVDQQADGALARATWGWVPTPAEPARRAVGVTRRRDVSHM